MTTPRDTTAERERLFIAAKKTPTGGIFGQEFASLVGEVQQTFAQEFATGARQLSARQLAASNRGEEIRSASNRLATAFVKDRARQERERVREIAPGVFQGPIGRPTTQISFERAQESLEEAGLTGEELEAELATLVQGGFAAAPPGDVSLGPDEARPPNIITDDVRQGVISPEEALEQLTETFQGDEDAARTFFQRFAPEQLAEVDAAVEAPESARGRFEEIATQQQVQFKEITATGQTEFTEFGEEIPSAPAEGIDDAFGAVPTRFDPEALAAFINPPEPDDALGAVPVKFDEKELSAFIKSANQRLQGTPIEPDDAFGEVTFRFDESELSSLIATARRQQEIQQQQRLDVERSVVAQEDVLGAPQEALTARQIEVVALISPFVSASGVSVAASIANGVDPQVVREYGTIVGLDLNDTVDTFVRLNSLGLVDAQGGTNLQRARSGSRGFEETRAPIPVGRLLTAGFTQSQISGADEANTRQFGGLVGRTPLPIKPTPVEASTLAASLRDATRTNIGVGATILAAQVATVSSRLDPSPLKDELDDLTGALFASATNELSERLADTERQLTLSGKALVTLAPIVAPDLVDGIEATKTNLSLSAAALNRLGGDLTKVIQTGAPIVAPDLTNAVIAAREDLDQSTLALGRLRGDIAIAAGIAGPIAAAQLEQQVDEIDEQLRLSRQALGRLGGDLTTVTTALAPGVVAEIQNTAQELDRSIQALDRLGGDVRTLIGAGAPVLVPGLTEKVQAAQTQLTQSNAALMRLRSDIRLAAEAGAPIVQSVISERVDAINKQLEDSAAALGRVDGDLVVLFGIAAPGVVENVSEVREELQQSAAAISRLGGDLRFVTSKIAPVIAPELTQRAQDIQTDLSNSLAAFQRLNGDIQTVIAAGEPIVTAEVRARIEAADKQLTDSAVALDRLGADIQTIAPVIAPGLTQRVNDARNDLSNTAAGLTRLSNDLQSLERAGRPIVAQALTQRLASLDRQLNTSTVAVGVVADEIRRTAPVAAVEAQAVAISEDLSNRLDSAVLGLEESLIRRVFGAPEFPEGPVLVPTAVPTEVEEPRVQRLLLQAAPDIRNFEQDVLKDARTDAARAPAGFSLPPVAGLLAPAAAAPGPSQVKLALVTLVVAGSIVAANPELVDDVRSYFAGLRSTREIGPAISSPPGIPLQQPGALSLPQPSPVVGRISVPGFAEVKIDPSPPGFITDNAPPELKRFLDLSQAVVADNTVLVQSLANPTLFEEITTAAAQGTRPQLEELSKQVGEAGLSEKVVREIGEIVDRIEKGQPINDRQRRHLDRLDEGIKRRQLVAQAAEALVVSGGFAPNQANNPNVVSFVTTALLPRPSISKEIGGGDVPPLPKEKPGFGGAPDRADPRPDPRADPVQLPDATPLRIIPIPVAVPATAPIAAPIFPTTPIAIPITTTVSPTIVPEITTGPGLGLAPDVALTTIPAVTEQPATTPTVGVEPALAVSPAVGIEPAVTTRPTTATRPLSATSPAVTTRLATRAAAPSRVVAPARPAVKPAVATPAAPAVSTTPRPKPGFKLPNGETLPEGFFAEVVEWPQGENMVRYNLFTGAQTWTDRKPDGTKAEKGFRVVKRTRTPPPRRVMPMGVFDVTTSRFGLQFVKKTNKKQRDRKFRSSRGRP